MTKDTQAVVKLDELELGLYRRGDEVVVYVNQGGVCIFRKNVGLVAELAGEAGKVVSLETLRRVSKSVCVGSKRKAM
jgi:hypothetical protein